MHEPGQFLASEELKNIVPLAWLLGRAGTEQLSRCYSCSDPVSSKCGTQKDNSVSSLEVVKFYLNFSWPHLFNTGPCSYNTVRMNDLHVTLVKNQISKFLVFNEHCSSQPFSPASISVPQDPLLSHFSQAVLFRHYSASSFLTCAQVVENLVQSLCKFGCRLSSDSPK